MKRSAFIILVFLAFAFSCVGPGKNFSALNSESFPESSISIDAGLVSHLKQQSSSADSVQNVFRAQLDVLSRKVEKLKTNPSDTLWNSIDGLWRKIGKEAFADGSGYASPDFMQKWADMNVSLIKVSGEVRFGDELEKVLYQSPKPVLSERQLKSVVDTHIDDRIFINIFGSSSVVHHHTTGGNIKLIQQTNFPESNEVTLTIESGDVRFLDVYIRIPEWAQNPTVQHGNVKYVARPGEYCEISRKWKSGDQIDIRLKN